MVTTWSGALGLTDPAAASPWAPASIEAAGGERRLGALLATYRKRAWLTQEQLAERAGLSVRTVSNLEADRVRRHPPASRLRRSEPEARWEAHDHHG